MNKKIGFVVASTLFLIVVLSTPLAFAQTWTSCELNAQVELLVTDEENGFFSFYVITPLAGTPNNIKASGSGGSYDVNLVPTDAVVVSYTNFLADDLTYSDVTGHLIYTGPADSITINAVEIPEFSSFLILPLFMMATLLAAIVLRRKRTS